MGFGPKDHVPAKETAYNVIICVSITIVMVTIVMVTIVINNRYGPSRLHREMVACRKDNPTSTKESQEKRKLQQ